MTSTSIKRVAVLCAVVGISGMSGHARADNQTFNDPFGDAPSWAYIGSDPNWYNSHWIGWKNKDTGACEWQWIGDQNGITLPTTVKGLGGNDSIIAVSGSMEWCGYTLAAPTINQYNVALVGGSGDDYLSLGTFRGGMAGGIGNDTLYGTQSGNWAYGEDGNDIIVLLGGAGSFAYGGPGDDCLNVNFVNPELYVCGAGNDRWWGPGAQPSDCEAVVCCGYAC